MSVAKIIELVGSSSTSWEDAANQAFIQASKTVRNIKGLKVLSQTAVINDNQIVEYRTAVKISFEVER